MTLRGLILLIGAWLATRALLVSVGLWDLPFYPSGPLAFDDLLVYEGWLPSLAAGNTPSDELWQYPPLAGAFFLIGMIGSVPVVGLLAGILLADLALTLVLFRHRPQAGWFWIVAGLAIGPILVSRFDVVPTLFAVLAVLHAARPIAVGAWAALGASLKVWPFLILLIVPKQQVFRAGTAFVAVAAAALVTTLAIFSGASGFLGGQGSRGLQIESVAAVPFVLAKSFGAPVTYEYRYGSMEVESAGAGFAATLAVLATVFGLGWLIWAWWRGTLARHQAADVALLAVLFSVVTSRVFSPQYAIWLLGIGAICWVTASSKLRQSVALIFAATLIAQVLYPWGYGALLSGQGWAVTLQLVRIILVVAAAVLAARALLLSPDSEIDLTPSEVDPGTAGKPAPSGTTHPAPNPARD